MKYLILSISLLLFSVKSTAQIDTINAINNKLIISNLHLGKSTYLVYSEDSLHQKISSGDIWERTTEIIQLNNKKAIKFTWKWYKKDSLLSVTTNIMDYKTLKPLYHKLVYKNEGIIAYDFQNDYLVPSDTVANNYAVNYPKRKLEIPVLNWEQDLETYPLLPITNVGNEFSISFFDTNEEKASYHNYKVIDEQLLKLNNSTSIKCWLLKTEYSNKNYAIFWLSEATREVLKMEEYFDGKYRYKVKLY